MPHIVIEYNPAVSETVSVSDLVEALHGKAMTLEALPLGGIRTRAHCADFDAVGDGAAENAFIYITIRLGQGRSQEVKKDIGDTLFAVLTEFTEIYFDQNKPISLGLEIQEIEKDWTWKKNNIHQILKEKNNG